MLRWSQGCTVISWSRQNWDLLVVSGEVLLAFGEGNEFSWTLTHFETGVRLALWIANGHYSNPLMVPKLTHFSQLVSQLQLTRSSSILNTQESFAFLLWVLKFSLLPFGFCSLILSLLRSVLSCIAFSFCSVSTMSAIDVPPKLFFLFPLLIPFSSSTTCMELCKEKGQREGTQCWHIKPAFLSFQMSHWGSHRLWYFK